MEIGLGCVRLGGGDGRSVADDIRLVHGAIDLGVTVFDTADVYGSGTSEHVLGTALRHRRDDVRIATKAGYLFRDRSLPEQWARRRAKTIIGAVRKRGGSNQASTSATSSNYAHQDFSPTHLRASVHASLKRLQTDRIDVFQLHGPEAGLPTFVDQLVDLVAAGDIVQIGIGAESVEQATGWLGATGISVLQLPFGLLDPEAASQVFPRAAALEQEVWVRGLLGAGLLPNSRHSPPPGADASLHQRIERCRALGDEFGIDLHQLGLAFARVHASQFSTAVIGTTSLAHLAADIAALHSAAVDDLDAALRAFASDAETWSST